MFKLVFFCTAFSIFRPIQQLTSKGPTLTFGSFIKALPTFILPYNTPEDYMRTSGFIVYYGYSGETYTVETEDGYLCDIFRIQGKQGVTKKYPVLMVHGFFTSSIMWIINKPNNSLGFVLADEGYDVWLGNLRGTSYCQRHVNLSSSNPEFWDFSWDENGRYDVSSMVDFILTKTKKSKVILIGHSKGTTSNYVLLSNRTEYNDKVKGVVSLASCTDLHKLTSPGILLSFIFLPLLQLFTYVTGVHQYVPFPSPGLQFCQISPSFCVFGNAFTEGIFTEAVDTKRMSILFSHIPDFTSFKDIKHFRQVYHQKEFVGYDYGSAKQNIKRWGTSKPPYYDLSKVKVPVAMFWGTGDQISTQASNERTKSLLANVILFKETPFAHTDYFLAKDLYSLMIKHIIKVLEKWNDSI